MTVRQTALRLGAVLVGLSGLGVALPSLADSNDRCAVRRDVEVRLPGLDPDQVRIERVVGRSSVALVVRAGSPGTVRATDVFRGPLRACGSRQADVSYRVMFLAGAPGGHARVAVEALNPAGKPLRRDVSVRRVSPSSSRPAAPASAAPTSPAPTSPAPGPASPAPALPAPVDSPDTTELAVRSGGGGSPLSSAVVATGLGVVTAAAAIAVLVRRRRATPDTAVAPAVVGLPGPRLPTLPGRWPVRASGIRRKET